MKRTSGHALVAILGVIFSICTMVGLHAQTYTFTGASGVDNNWSTGANWLGGTAPPLTDTTDDIVLSGSTTISNIDAAYSGYTINSLTQAVGSGYTLTGVAITDSTGDFVNNSSSDLNIAANVTGGSGIAVNNGVVRFTGTAYTLDNFNVASTGTAYFDNTTTSLYGQYYVSASGSPTPNGFLGGIGTLNFGLVGNGVNVGTAGYQPNGGATISPGDPTINNGIGTLTINGNLAIATGGASLDFVLGSAGNSEIAAEALSLGIDETFNITDAGGTAPGTYDLISYTSGQPTSGDLSTDALALPEGWAGSLGSNSTDLFLILSTADAVPEPSTWAEIVLGLITLVVVSRRRQGLRL